MNGCAVKGLTARGKKLVEKMRAEKKEAEFIEKCIKENTDDVMKSFQIKNGNDVIGKVMVNVSKIFGIHTTSIHEQEAIQRNIDHSLIINGLIYKVVK